MKPLAIGAWLVCGLLASAPLTAQQKLGDVAGSIKLNKTGSEKVVIDGSNTGQAARSSSSTSDSNLLYELMNDSLEASEALSAIVKDAPRIRPVRYSDAWRSQLEGVGERLRTLGQELQMLPDAGPFEAAYEKAMGGLDMVREGYDQTIEVVDRRELVGPEIKQQVTNGIAALESAMTEVRSVERSEQAAAPAPPIDPIAASTSIEKVCMRAGAEGSQAFRDCVDQQDAAMNALVGRTPGAVGLDSATFNKIRNGCLYEWPDNYFNRDACEKRRAANASRN